MLLLLGLVACHKPVSVADVAVEMIPIDSTLDAVADTAYLAALAPCREAMEREMNVVLGHAPKALRVYAPESEMLNWTSDALLSKARQLYLGHVDMAVVNIGGVRCDWPQGAVTRRSVYQLMPFDNELVVITLSGADVLDLFGVFVADNGQGIAGARIVGRNGQLVSATVDGQPVVADRYYHVATSDYLCGGMDHMVALTRYTEIWHSERRIRDLYEEAVREQGEVVAQVDGRMTLN